MIPVLVLAGGLGTRMRHITGPDLPKCLLPVAGEPFILHQRDWLRNQGFRDTSIIYSLGYRAHEVMRVLGSVNHYMTEQQPLGQVRAIRAAIQGFNLKVFFVLYGDVLPRYTRHALCNPLLPQTEGVISRHGSFLDCGFNLYVKNAYTFRTVEVPRSYEIGSPEGYNELQRVISGGDPGDFEAAPI